MFISALEVSNFNLSSFHLVCLIILSGLHTANLSWKTRVGKPKLMCVNSTKTGGKHVCKLTASNRNVFADCFYAVHARQLEFAKH